MHMFSGFVKQFINSVSVLPSTQRYVYSVTELTRHRSQTKIPKVEQNKLPGYLIYSIQYFIVYRINLCQEPITSCLCDLCVFFYKAMSYVQISLCALF